MSTRLLRPFLLLATLVVGCAPTVRVNVLEPARVNLGASKRLTIVQTEGRRGARDAIIEEVLRQARGGGYFQAADRSEEGITVKVAGRTVDVSPGKSSQGQAPDEIGLRIDVLGWDTSKDTRTVKGKDSKGRETSHEERVFVGKVVLGVTAFNAQGKALLSEKEYEATIDAKESEDALPAAARAAVSYLLADITPHYVTKYIRMDDADETQKPIIKVAEGGNLGQAVTEMQAYAKANPNNSAAQYNLAVLLDATGQYQEALDLYTRAITLSSKDFYVNMKSECARRLQNQQALAQ